MDPLSTERLRLEPYKASDVDHLLRLRSDEKVWMYSSSQADSERGGAERQLHSLIEKYSNHEFAPYALFTKEGTYIGEAGAYNGNKESRRVNIGYNLLSKFWGNGYATEITKEIINWYFLNTSIQRIEATVLQKNTNSIRVLEKSKMELEGVLRKYTIIDGISHNLCFYSIIR